MGYESYVSYVLALCCVTGFAVYAFIRSYQHNRKGASTEEFITARGQVSMWRVAWSFYAGAAGAWALVSPPQYAVIAGVIGLITYSISSGLPILLIALFGHHVQSKFPHVFSLSDYVGQRFGKVVQAYIVLLSCFNMVIALLAEFTTIGSLVADFVGLPPVPIILTVGLMTMFYTAAGGLYVSIITDQVQGIASIILVVFLIFYISITFRRSIPSDLPPELGATETGYSSLLAMPVALFTATVFSEAVWQRVWASENRRALNLGAAIGSIGIVLLVSFTSLCGFIAYWSGLITSETNENLYFFVLITNDTEAGDQKVNNWAGILSMVLAVTMNESAVDSLQNGLVAAIGGYFLKNKDINYVRICVVLVNVPVIVLSTFNFNVLELFLLTNMLCSTSALPILLGVVEGRLEKYINELTVLGACIFSVFSVCTLGIIEKDSFADGMYHAWIGNNYNWKYFLVAVGSSAFFLVASGILIAVINRLVDPKIQYKRAQSKGPDNQIVKDDQEISIILPPIKLSRRSSSDQINKVI
eukprot:TRINITY_DN1083_c1_g1_i7.p1 TRINITY_DN1083_c1_g1~~TRINITY_DN1083_c1_g1_i7.p1  ORF type:complete len:530 (-),score=37.94 TRINITY_DN1083_c1_g1_i7:2593-4182(-)